MSKSNFSAVIDLGSSNFRFGVYDNNYRNLYSSTISVFQNEVNENYYENINFLIRDAEKKISSHIKSIIVMYDSSEIYSIDISLKRIFDQKENVKKTFATLIKEANQIVKSSYINKKIIHFNITSYKIDGEKYLKKVEDNLNANSIVLDLKFICLPVENYNKIVNIFKNNNIDVSDFFCSSYVKSFFYLDFFKADKELFFLDIGLKRSTLLFFDDKVLSSFNCIPVGGNHITKDISKVMEIDLENSEKIKKSLNSSETEFAYDKILDDKKNNIVKELINKNISADLLKKVVLARVEEIIELIFKNLTMTNRNACSGALLVLIGNGSKLLNKNSFHFEERFNYKEISFFDENDVEICKAGLNFKIKNDENNFLNMVKKPKKTGIFEKFFNLFSK